MAARLKPGVGVAIFFCDTRRPPEIDEMCVVFSLPLKKARLVLSPALNPVEGLEAMVGAATK